MEFVKKYSKAHSVTYTGVISDEGKKIAGDWSIGDEKDEGRPVGTFILEQISQEEKKRRLVANAEVYIQDE